MLEKKILKTVLKSDFIKGLEYPKSYILPLNCITFTNQAKLFKFKVQSQNTKNIYKCEVLEQDGEIIKTNCTCPKFASDDSCKHIACILQMYGIEIYEFTKEEQTLTLSKKILTSLVKNKANLAKELIHLGITLSFQNTYLEVTLKIGQKKLYVLNQQLLTFFHLYSKEEGTLFLGKNFVYQPDNMYFSKEDSAILNYLKEIAEKNSYQTRNGKILILLKEIDSFFHLLKNHCFEVKPYGTFLEVKEENPISTFLSFENGYYHLFFPNLEQTHFLTQDKKYVIQGDSFYHLSNEVAHFLQKLEHYHLKELHFEEEDINDFANGIYPLLSLHLQVSEEIASKFVIQKPIVQMYFDYQENLECKVCFVYQEASVGYLEPANFIRDEKEEENAIEALKQYHFSYQDKAFYLTEPHLIASFLEEGLPHLTTLYETFTTEKVKCTKIVKKIPFTSHFSIGKDNIFSYHFDLGPISYEEIEPIIENMHLHKKYYRLKNGDLLALEQIGPLEEIHEFLEDFPIPHTEVEGVLPKYRALYLDSLKKEKYPFLSTNSTLDDFIQNFHSFKDAKIHLNKKDKAILRDYQVTGIKWLYSIYKCEMGAILADEMGLGKSIQTICFLKEVIKDKKDAKILIIAPTSLVYNWQHELNKYGQELTYQIVMDKKPVREHLLKENANIWITTYGLVRRDLEMYQDLFFDVVIVDEAQNIKNPYAATTKAIKKLNVKTRFALTGTPTQNSILELWSIFDFLMPGFFPPLKHFQNMYHVREMNEEEKNRLELLKRQIAPFILRRKKQDVIKELPEKLENNVYLELTKEQKKLYISQVEKTKKEMDSLIKQEGFLKARFKILQLLTRLRQICIDPKIIFDDYVGGSSKIDQLMKTLQELIFHHHKILIFTSYKTALELVREELEKAHISSYTIDGATASKKRVELVDAFNQDETNVFLITLASGGTGLNLTGADVVIHLDLWWNPQIEAQATDRAHRIGQKNTVEVIRFICKDTIEEKIVELQEKKKELAEFLIETDTRDKNIFSTLTAEDIKSLLAYGEKE